MSVMQWHVVKTVPSERSSYGKRPAATVNHYQASVSWTETVATTTRDVSDMGEWSEVGWRTAMKNFIYIRVAVLNSMRSQWRLINAFQWCGQSQTGACWRLTADVMAGRPESLRTSITCKDHARRQNISYYSAGDKKVADCTAAAQPKPWWRQRLWRWLNQVNNSSSDTSRHSVSNHRSVDVLVSYRQQS